MNGREKQNLIIETAIRLFNDTSVDATSMRQIASECKISSGNLHYHFPSKQEIIRCIFNEMLNIMHLQWDFSKEPRAISNVKSLYERYVRLVWKYKFFFREKEWIFAHDPQMEKKYTQLRQALIHEMESYYNEFVELGIIKQPEPPYSIYNIVVLGWIFTDSWLGFVESRGDTFEEHHIEEGFSHVEAFMQPYIKKPAAYATIHQENCRARN